MPLVAASEAGFSLLEAMIATGLLAGSIAFLGQMFAMSIASHSSARAGAYAAVLAAQRLEQLRGLTWSVGALGEPLSDLSTNLALPVQSPAGGTGLSHSPPNSLETNVEGYVDYVDQFGRILGGGSTVPDRALYIRRWSVEPLPANPNDTLVLQVVVKSRNRGAAGRDEGGAVDLPSLARLMTVKTRKAR
jgi:hypothetical protein